MRVVDSYWRVSQVADRLANYRLHELDDHADRDLRRSRCDHGGNRGVSMGASAVSALVTSAERRRLTVGRLAECYERWRLTCHEK